MHVKYGILSTLCAKGRRELCVLWTLMNISVGASMQTRIMHLMIQTSVARAVAL